MSVCIWLLSILLTEYSVFTFSSLILHKICTVLVALSDNSTLVGKYNQFPGCIYVNFICRLCFVKLKLLLLAIEAKQGEGGDSKISINPRNNKIVANMVGFFMAQSEEEVKR